MPITPVKKTGLQLAGVGNFSNVDMSGVQVAGVFNYTKKLKGLQVGLINVADSSAGMSIGLINIVLKNGYHKLSLYRNEVMNANVDIETGNPKLCTIIKAGVHVNDSAKLFSFGAGLGHDFIFGKRLSLSGGRQK